MTKTKIIKNTQTVKPPKRNLKDIYNSLKHDVNALLAFMFYYKDIDFHKKGSNYICNQSNGLKAIKTPNGYTLHNHSGKLNIQNGNISTQIRLHTSNVARANRANEQYKILERLGVDTTNSTLSTVKLPFNLAPKATNSKSEQTAHKNNKSALSVKFGGFNSYCGKSMLEYFKKKTGASKRTLSKYNVLPILERSVNSHTFKHGSNNFAFAFSTTTHTKVKNPTSDKNPYQIITKDTKRTYCFGLDQLPKTGDYLIICAGETDAICINHHLNKYGVFAICFGGESNKPPKQLLNSLKKRFKRCFVLYDNDCTGIEKSKLLAFNNGLIWVNIKDAFVYFGIPNYNAKTGNIKDICNVFEYFEQIGLNGHIRPFLNYCLSVNSNIQQYTDDPFSIGVKHCYKLNFRQYIGEKEANKNGLSPTDFLVHQLMTNNKLILQAPAGTGKSTWVQSLAKDGNRLLGTVNNTLECSTLIIGEPTTAIALQLYNSFLDSGIPKSRLALVMGKDKNGKVRGRVTKDQIIIVVFDSLKKVDEYINDSLFIVDEYHQIGNDQNYRDVAMLTLWKAMQKAKKVLLLSATPNYLFTTDLHKGFNYKLIVAKPSVVNEINLKTYLHNCPKKDLYTFLEHIAPKEGTICIKRDHNEELKAFGELCKSRGISFEHFTSGLGRAFKEDNLNYQSIMQSGKLKNKVRYLVFTTILEAGVSLKDAIALMALTDVIAWSKIIQLCTRPRQNTQTGENMSIEVALFIPNKRKVEPIKYTAKSSFEDILKDATHFCDLLTKERGKIPKEMNRFKRQYKLSSDIRKMVYFDNLEGVYKPDISAILYQIYTLETSNTDTLTLLRRISRFDNRFTIHTPELVEPDRDREIDDMLDLVEIEKEDSKEAFIKLFRNEPSKAAQAVCYLSKDIDFKNSIKGVLQLKEVNKEEIKPFIEANKEAFKTREPKRMIKQAYDLMFTGTSMVNAFNMIVESDKKDIQLYIERTNIKKRCKHIRDKTALHESDKIEVEKYKALVGKFKRILNNIQQGKRKNQFTGDQLDAFVNNILISKGIIKKRLPKTMAIKQIKAIFDIENKPFRIRGKLKKMFYFKTLGIGKIERPNT